MIVIHESPTEILFGVLQCFLVGGEPQTAPLETLCNNDPQGGLTC